MMFILTPVQFGYVISLIEEDLSKVISVKKELIQHVNIMEIDTFEEEYEKVFDSQKKIEDVIKLMQNLRAEPTPREGQR